ncbi:hypothetical protein [Candidatus Poriferisodalis sp.]|uniref:hypothetical protein n=1 Tax=Candidatus Poriferisodalis sp. TaxID=3101277 RepID=UPI003D12E5C1
MWPASAFYNPGVGMWQIDDAGLYPYLNHGERASTVIGGRNVADQFRDAACGVADAAERLVAIKNELNHWHACTSGTRNTATMRHPSYPCLEADDNRASYSRLYVEPQVEVGVDGLHVTTDHNPGEYQIAGGVHAWRCRWGSSGEIFDCWFYDTTSPEGWLDAYDPQANNNDSWKYSAFDRTDKDDIRLARARCPDEVVVSLSEDGDEDEDRVMMAWCRIRNPLAAPFFAFTEGGFRFVVFPKSVLASLRVGSGSTAHTLIKRVQENRNVRLAATLATAVPSWERNTHGGQELQVQVCDGASAELGQSPSECPWVSANDAGLARRLGVSDGPSFR